MQNRRHERVRELLKRELSVILHREFRLADAGLMSVNEVTLSGDLQQATVYVGIVGSVEQRQHGFELLEQHCGRLRGLLGGSVILKHTPELRFVADDSIERGNKILKIIEDIEKSLPPQAS